MSATVGLSQVDLELSRGGDREAYGRLVHQTRHLVSSVALSTVNDVSASQDIAQEVYLHAWAGLRQLRSFDSFLPWLRQLTRNRANEFLRERYRRARLVGDDAIREVVDPRADAPTQLLAREEQQRLAEAIDALPDETREVLTLFYREGQSVAQVARLLELSEVAVKKRLSRARAVLRERVLSDDDVGHWLERSAPGDAFCSAVIAALPVGAPLAGAGVAGLGSAALTSGALKVLASLGGAVGGPVTGVLAVLWGHRKEMARAHDDEERTQLIRLRNVSLAFTVTFGVTVFVASVLDEIAVVLVGGFVFIGALTPLYAIWLPRIRARRYAAELREDPSAASRHRREKVVSWVGCLFGSATALGTLVWLMRYL